ncbi:hypothetical protein HK104_005703 [Borealophlyctis nickersoniae]|nr:hypothetical protein HK104_005703 [Borealophlyctis nickersoniae]
MCYKFALESYNGTIKALALDRLPESQRFTFTGYLDGFNQAAQCIGSIAVAPLVRRFNIKSVLATAIAVFAGISAVSMVVEAATGGRIQGGRIIAGSWDPVGVIPIFVASGFSHGTVELIRRIIPRDIVGGDVIKLKKMDALVHIFYEVAGTAGAFFATFMALKLGKGFAPIVTPIFFTVAAILWSRIAITPADKDTTLTSLEHHRENIFVAVGNAFKAFGLAIYEGGRIIFTNRRFTWLIFGYSIPLVLHRYLENGLAANYAKIVLNESAYGSLIVGGSNFGELLGALFVFIFTYVIRTPLPWLRLDAITLSIVWVLYAITPTTLGISPLGTAGVLAAIFIPVSMGWAAGDVSLAAFIQSHVSRLQDTNPHVSSLGAVMSFLYVLYIVLFAIMSPVIGQWVDGMPKEDKGRYFFWIGGVMYTILGVVIFASTFWPRGSWKFNPTLEEDYPDVEDDVEQNADAGAGGKGEKPTDEMMDAMF